MEKGHLLSEVIATRLGDINEVEHCSGNMSEGCNGCHFNGIPLLQGMIQNSGGVNHLPATVLKVHVADKETLCRKGVGLHINVCLSHDVHEGRLSYVRISRQDERPRAWIDGR